MDERRSNIGGAAWPGLMIVLVGLYAFWVRDRGLDSARPQHAVQGEVPQPVPREGLHAIHARLWEDPIAVSFQDAGIPVLGDSGDSPAQNGGAGRGAGNARPTLKPTIDAALQKLQLDTVLMPVLVPGGPSAEDKEQRLRIRYAVVTALSEAGYALSYPTRLTYMVVDDIQVHATPAATRKVRLVVPVKLYRRDELRAVGGSNDSINPPSVNRREFQVIVLWVNESQLGEKPLGALRQLIESVTVGADSPLREHETESEEQVDKESREHIHVHVIGPASSDTLIDIAKEVDAAPLADLPDVRIFSPRATIGRRLTAGVDRTDGDGTRQLIERLENDFNSIRNGFQFVRVVGHDADLVQALEQELRLRDAWPAQHAGRELVLVTESDTSYGRDIVNLFEDALQKTAEPHRHADHEHGTERHTHDDPGTERHQPHLHVVKYLRGIDGQTVIHGRGESSAPDQVDEYSSGSDAFTDDAAETVHLYRPEGQSQFDYLLRLRETLRQIERGEHHDDADEHFSTGLDAIGVVGTDVYDKLLILRALRSEFPRTVFFTTDLDTQFWHPAEYASTRNLIVASHFGLELGHRLQKTTPPFRDSYQTSTFLAVRIALEDIGTHNSDINVWDPWGIGSDEAALVGNGQRLQPHVYEIGRHGPLQLVPLPEHARPGMTWSLRIAVFSAWLLIGIVVSQIRSVHAMSERLLNAFIRGVAAGRKLSERLYAKFLESRIGPRPQASETESDRNRSGAATADTPRSPLWTAAGVALLGVLLTAAVLAIAHDAQSYPDREPFNFTNAVSMWPSTFLRIAAIVVAIAYFAFACLNNDPDVGAPPGLFKDKYTADESGFFQLICEMPLQRRAILSGGCTLLAAAAFLGVHHHLGYRDFAPHTIRGEAARTFSMLVHLTAVIFALAVATAAVVRFEFCRKSIALIADNLRAEDPLVPYGAIRYIGSRTRILRREIGWVVILVVLLSVPYHPRMDYSPMSPVMLVCVILTGGALLLWSTLIRRRANDARRTAIRELGREKRYVNDLDSSALPDNDPWSKAVELSRQRHSGDTGPEISTAVATKVECDFIDNEIELIRQVDEGAYAPWYSAPGFAWLSGSAGAWAVLDILLRTAQSGF